jgi:hypothetical protein
MINKLELRSNKKKRDPPQIAPDTMLMVRVDMKEIQEADERWRHRMGLT